MRERGGVLLIACYEMGHSPLAVAWPAAFLERAGFSPAVMDLSLDPFDPEPVRAARLVAISVPMHTALRLGVRVAERVRALNPSAHVCFYGLYASLNADELLAGCADTVLAGELEDALVDLARRVEAAVATRPASAPAAACAAVPATGAVRQTLLTRLAFPVPSRGALAELKRYAHLERDERLELAGYVEASRGCKHWCRHCPIPPVYGGRFFVVPVQTCLADVRQQVAAGARHITFGDPDFLNGPGHAVALARAVHAEFPDVTFDFTAKVEHLLRHRARLPELAALGCLFVVTAAESLDDGVLGHLDKGHSRADIVEVLEVARTAGIVLRPTWVAFTPWTSLEAYREWLDFIERESLIDAVDPVQYAVRLLVPPGSLLANHPAMAPHLGELVAGHFYHRWTHPDPRMEQLHADVTAAVAAAARRREDAGAVFGRVRALADSAAGMVGRPAPALPADRRRAPRLTEPWFC
jgi:radical SAM superfamily enzyme YgiQ (UPF0313 family)